MYPDFNKEFILDTDASDNGIGGILSQIKGNEERVIGYASRSLTKPERRTLQPGKNSLPLLRLFNTSVIISMVNRLLYGQITML